MPLKIYSGLHSGFGFINKLIFVTIWFRWVILAGNDMFCNGLFDWMSDIGGADHIDVIDQIKCLRCQTANCNTNYLSMPLENYF